MGEKLGTKQEDPFKADRESVKYSRRSQERGPSIAEIDDDSEGKVLDAGEEWKKGVIGPEEGLVIDQQMGKIKERFEKQAEAKRTQAERDNAVRARAKMLEDSRKTSQVPEKKWYEFWK